MTEIKSERNRDRDIRIPFPSPEISDLVLTNEKWLKECDTDYDLSPKFIKYISNVLSDIDVNYETLSFLSKQELCSQFRSYQQYLIFNKKMGNKRINTLTTQRSIFNNNTLPSQKTPHHTTDTPNLYKSFPFEYNGLPFIFSIKLTGYKEEFEFFAGVLFQNYDVVKNLNFGSPRILKLNGSKLEDSSIYIDLFWTDADNLGQIPEYRDYKSHLKGIGKKCLCLLFKYFIDFGYITRETLITLDAAGSFVVTKSNENNKEKIETALQFIKKYQEAFYLHLQSRYEQENYDKNINIIPSPYYYRNYLYHINRYLNYVYENMRLVNYYYESLGFKVDKEYYLNKDFNPLYIKLENTVGRLISKC
jgi:hypothetical protein